MHAEKKRTREGKKDDPGPLSTRGGTTGRPRALALLLYWRTTVAITPLRASYELHRSIIVLQRLLCCVWCLDRLALSCDHVCVPFIRRSELRDEENVAPSSLHYFFFKCFFIPTTIYFLTSSLMIHFFCIPTTIYFLTSLMRAVGAKRHIYCLKPSIGTTCGRIEGSLCFVLLVALLYTPSPPPPPTVVVVPYF